MDDLKVNTSVGNNRPSYQQIEDWCEKRKLIVNPKKFYDYYSRMDWKMKTGKAVDDWRSLLEYWDRMDRKSLEERDTKEHSRISNPFLRLMKEGKI